MADTKDNRKIAVVRVRGQVDIRAPIKDTLNMLNLRKVNWMTVVDDTPQYRGMIQKSKDFITWGEMDPELFSKIVRKWGRKSGDKKLDESEADKFATDFMSGKTTFKESGVRPYFRLHAPSKGHNREGIRRHVSIGGVLGNRGGKINDLLTKMAGIKDGTKE